MKCIKEIFVSSETDISKPKSIKLPEGKLTTLSGFFIFMSEIICKKCGAIDCYTTTQRGKHVTAYCTSCDAYIKNLPQGKPPILFFGKYKDREIASLKSDEEIRYLQWLVEQTFVKTKLKDDISAHLKTV